MRQTGEGEIEREGTHVFGGFCEPRINVVEDVRNDSIRGRLVGKVERRRINEGERHGLGRAGVGRVEDDI